MHGAVPEQQLNLWTLEIQIEVIHFKIIFPLINIQKCTKKQNYCEKNNK